MNKKLIIIIRKIIINFSYLCRPKDKLYPMKLSHASLIILLILIADQASKIYIKTHFMLDQSINVFDWFHIRFVENPGAAWGIGIPGKYGKLILTLFRMVVLFDHSMNNVATFLSDHPYGSLFHGKVVDMLYFPLIDTTLPEWIPFYGGHRFTFFDPIFNIADTSISVAVGLLIIFNKQAFRK